MGAEFNCSKDRQLTDGTRLEHLVAGCVEIALACVIFALLHVSFGPLRCIARRSMKSSG